MYVWYGILLCGLFTNTLAKSISLKAEKQPWTLEEAALDKFKQKKLIGVWISDNELEYRDAKTGDVNILNAATLKTTQFVPNSVIEKYHGVSYNVSADRKFMLIKYDSKIVRDFKINLQEMIGFKLQRQFMSNKFVIGLLHQVILPLKYLPSVKYKATQVTLSMSKVIVVDERKYYDVSNKEILQTAQWAPSGNALVYIKNNNMYYLPSITSAMKPQQLTADGVPGVIFNGATDWVYEEEVLCTDTAFYFSPKGDQLVYVKFIDTKVGEVQYMEYGTPGDYSNLYPREVKLRFPKVGTPNPVYQVWWVDLTNLKNQRLLQNYSSSQPEREVYYGNVWINNQAGALVFSNRVQNESQIVIYEIKLNKTVTIYKDKNPRGWANTEIPKFAESPNRMMKINAQPFNKDEFDHLTVVLETGVYALTSGAYEVIDILDWDRKNKVVYYRATEENSPSTIQVYRISEEKGSKPYCLTCRIKSPEGRGCKHATAAFSKGYTYVVIQCDGPDPRMTYLFKNENPMKDALAVLDNSAQLRAALSNKLMPEIMNLTAKIPGNFNAEVRLYLPPKMDKSGKTKYPMLVYTYGGINSKLIYDDFKIDFEMYLTTNRSVIYAVIDARNTNNKGKNMLYAGYKNIGTLEMEDQITVTKYLQKTFNFIDTKRTGVWGWSFGGFSTLRILQLDKENIFKCGVAVAPAVDWVLYDTMWSERYMKSFKENKQGYLNASLFTHVKNLKGKDFYLITGNADDNVHYQQPMLLTRALELNDIMFESLSYPDEAHSLFGVRPHLYHSMDKYWRRCFNL